MNVGVLSFENYETRQKDSVGSSRIRVNWVVKYWPEAEEFQIAKKYDVVIFQKAYFSRYMKIYDGIKIIDLCDPDWMDKKPVVECIDLCDAVTCSSKGLFDFVKSITDKPVYFIPDRVDLSAIQDIKKHKGRAKTVAWYGYHNNFKMVDLALPTIKRLGLQLVVFSDFPYYPTTAIQGIDEQWIQLNIKNFKYNQETLFRDLVEYSDVVINPKSQEGKYKYKSDNKTVIAWALGLPVAQDSEDLELFVEEVERQRESEKRLIEVKEQYDSKLSVQEYKKVIQDIVERKDITKSDNPVSAPETL